MTIASPSLVARSTFTDGLTVDDDGTAPLTVDRATSDGDAIIIQKDGSQAGGIATSGGDTLEIYGEGSTKSGLRFGGSALLPLRNAGALASSVVDVGSSAYLFKDIYLSGGVRVGGTGSANLLDDYEQGSYTPSFSFTNGNGTLTTAAAVGSYTKIGNRVHINFYIKIGTLGTASGDMRFSGLPFTPAAVSNRYHSGSLWMNTTVSTNELDGNFMTMLLLSPGDATIRPYFMAGGGGVGHANNGDVQNNTDFAISMSYDTE